MTDQTDHRAWADKQAGGNGNFTAVEHLLAAIYDGQSEQTEWLHRIRDLLAVMAEPKGDPCPCGCRRDVESKPRLAEGGFTGPDDPSAEASPMRFHPDDQFLSAEQVRAAGKRAMESIRKKTAVDDFTTKVMPLGPEQDTLDGLLALAAADVPPEQMRRLASDWAAGRLATDPEPASESVTVTLPERILGRPWTVMELRMLAEWADNAGSGEAGAVLGHVADALDAASATQDADQREREAKAEAWDEGHDAGHQAARAINPEWPEQPTNPYHEADQ